MDLAVLAEHTGMVGGILIASGFTIRYGSDAMLRFVAGITAIVSRDEKTSRAERALEVLNALRRDRSSGPESTP